MKIAVAKTYASASKTRKHICFFNNILVSCVIALVFGISFLACHGDEDKPNALEKWRMAAS
jgi:hypothetical protein